MQVGHMVAEANCPHVISPGPRVCVHYCRGLAHTDQAHLMKLLPLLFRANDERSTIKTGDRLDGIEAEGRHVREATDHPAFVS